MIPVAIYGVNDYSVITEKMIQAIYNPYVEQSGNGEPLQVVAYVDIYRSLDEQRRFIQDLPVLDITEVNTHIASAEIEALMVPQGYFVNQMVLYNMRRAQLDLNLVYVVQQEFYEKGNYQVADGENMFVDFFDDPYLPYLEFHVEDRCNLNCKACEHYSPLVTESVQPNFEEFKKDLLRMKELIHNIGKIRILGGEPLLNPDLEKYVAFAASVYPKSHLYVVTNGLLVKNMPDSLFDIMREHNAQFAISFYKPMEQKMPELIEFIHSKGVEVELSDLIEEFSIKQNLTGDSEPDRMFRICFQSQCHNLYKGQLASCFLPFVTHYFNETFHKNIVEDGAIDIYAQDMTTRKLKEALEVPLERCRYCMDPVMIPWEQAQKEPTLSDWVFDED